MRFLRMLEAEHHNLSYKLQKHSVSPMCRLKRVLMCGCREIGIRFHPTRGAMSLGESKGGLPPDSCTEDETACLADMQRLIEEFHDNSKCGLILSASIHIRF